MRPRTRAAALALAAALGATLLAGCASGDDWTQPHDAPTAVGALREGFLPASPPSPEATIAPAPDSWADVHPSPGYRVVLLTAGDDAPALALVAAVEEWAGAEKVELRTIHADDDHIGGIVQAMDLHPDLIVTAGNDLIDALAAVTASHLDQQFLVVGAEVAEPTGNVTAVDWTGASFRGEGLGASSTYDPASFTPERCASAVRAGVASVLHDLTGIVLWIG
ncbi:MAG: hypothetical protein JWR01_575 [Subtercola sp.]|nr:hypothetical protein [Subtercola sp.]